MCSVQHTFACVLYEILLHFITGEAENHAAFTKHMESQLALYNHVTMVSLLDFLGKEKVMADAFLQHTLKFNSPDVTYVAFDFHEYCRGMRFENVSILTENILDVIKDMRYCWVDQNGMICEQRGVFRVNCLDCLDRTNVVQSAIARLVLEIQCRKLGLLPPDESLPLNCRVLYQQMWANNGDAISRQYAGTAALKGDFTRTGERKFSGLMKDGVNSANRYYINKVKDAYKQTTIDLLLGNSTTEDISALRNVTKGEGTGEEESDEQNLVEKEENLKILIDECKKLLITEPEECLGGWGLIDCDPVTGDPTQQDMDIILLLSQRAYYVARYDDDADVVTSYQKIYLEDIDRIEIGPSPSYSKSKRLCIRILYINKEPGFFHTFRTTNTRLFNNMVIYINNDEEAKESLRAISASFTAAQKLMSLDLEVVETRLDRKKSKIHQGIIDIATKAQEKVETFPKPNISNVSSTSDMEQLNQQQRRTYLPAASNPFMASFGSDTGAPTINSPVSSISLQQSKSPVTQNRSAIPHDIQTHSTIELARNSSLSSQINASRPSSQPFSSNTSLGLNTNIIQSQQHKLSVGSSIGRTFAKLNPMKKMRPKLRSNFMPTVWFSKDGDDNSSLGSNNSLEQAQILKNGKVIAKGSQNDLKRNESAKNMSNSSNNVNQLPLKSDFMPPKYLMSFKKNNKWDYDFHVDCCGIIAAQIHQDIQHHFTKVYPRNFSLNARQQTEGTVLRHKSLPKRHSNNKLVDDDNGGVISQNIDGSDTAAFYIGGKDKSEAIASDLAIDSVGTSKSIDQSDKGLGDNVQVVNDLIDISSEVQQSTSIIQEKPGKGDNAGTVQPSTPSVAIVHDLIDITSDNSNSPPGSQVNSTLSEEIASDVSCLKVSDDWVNVKLKADEKSVSSDNLDVKSNSSFEKLMTATGNLASHLLQPSNPMRLSLSDGALASSFEATMEDFIVDPLDVNDGGMSGGFITSPSDMSTAFSKLRSKIQTNLTIPSKASPRSRRRIIEDQAKDNIMKSEYLYKQYQTRVILL